MVPSQHHQATHTYQKVFNLFISRSTTSGPQIKQCEYNLRTSHHNRRGKRESENRICFTYRQLWLVDSHWQKWRISLQRYGPRSGDELSSRAPASLPPQRFVRLRFLGREVTGLDYVRPFVQIFIIMWKRLVLQERKNGKSLPGSGHVSSCFHQSDFVLKLQEKNLQSDKAETYKDVIHIMY